MKLLIAGINNLTDARYFAAVGAHYLHFDLGERGLDISSFHAVAEWIVGPELLVDAAYAAEMRAGSSVEVNLGGWRDEDTLEIDHSIFNLCKPSESQKAEEEFWWVYNLEDIEGISTKPYTPYGVAIPASGESEVGLKDFSFFDQLIEHLEEKNLS